MPQRQYYNVDPTLPQRDSKFNLLYTMDVVKLSKRCCNIEITTSYSKFLHNIDNETSRSQRRTNVVSTLDSKLTSKHILNVLMAISIQRGLVNVKFTKAYQRWYYVETTTLRQVWEKRKMWKSLITAWHLSGMQDQYCGIKYSPFFHSQTLKVSKNCFQKV